MAGGLSPRDQAGIRSAAREAIGAGQLPGAVILVARGPRVVFHEAFGRALTKKLIREIASLPGGQLAAVE